MTVSPVLRMPAAIPLAVSKSARLTPGSGSSPARRLARSRCVERDLQVVERREVRRRGPRNVCRRTGLAASRSSPPDDPQHLRDGEHVLAADRLVETVQLRPEPGCARSGRRDPCQSWPASWRRSTGSCRRSASRRASRATARVSPASRAAASPVPSPIPARDDLPGLRPPEDPRNRAQVRPGPPRSPAAARGATRRRRSARTRPASRRDSTRAGRRRRPVRDSAVRGLGDRLHHGRPAHDLLVGGARALVQDRRLDDGGQRELDVLRARPGRRYLSEITSPCSVSLISPSSVPHGCARIASWVGPPPRPIVPPRPWKRRSRTP